MEYSGYAELGSAARHEDRVAWLHAGFGIQAHRGRRAATLHLPRPYGKRISPTRMQSSNSASLASLASLVTVVSRCYIVYMSFLQIQRVISLPRSVAACANTARTCCAERNVVRCCSSSILPASSCTTWIARANACCAWLSFLHD